MRPVIADSVIAVIAWLKRGNTASLTRFRRAAAAASRLSATVPLAAASPRLTPGGNPPAGALSVTLNVSSPSASASSAVATEKVWRNPAPVAPAAKRTAPLDGVKSAADAVSPAARPVA